MNGEYYRTDIAAITSKLLDASPSKVWWTEETVCKDLGLKPTASKGSREILTDVLVSIKRGYAGKKSDGRPTRHDMADLYEEENGTLVRVVKHGRAVSFEGGTLSDTTATAKMRFFAFGSPRFSICNQISIANAIVGNDTTLAPSARKRREDNWRKWFRGDRDDGGFGKFDAAAIAHKYIECWEDMGATLCLPDPPNQLTRRAFLVDDIAAIEGDMRMMLIAFGMSGARHRTNLPSLFERASSRDELNDELEEDETCDEDAAVDNDASRHQTPSRRPDIWRSPSGTPYPDALRLSALTCRTKTGQVDMDKADELASIEYMLHLYVVEDVAASVLQKSMEDVGVSFPATVAVEEIIAMGSRSVGSARQQIKSARANLLMAYGDMFQPKEDEFLYQWFRDGRYVCATCIGYS